MLIEKTITVIMLFASALFALPFESFAKYEVKYGVFNLGEATTFLRVHENGSYETEIKAKAMGFAATLSGKRVETYKSVGKLVDGKFVPDTLEKVRSSNKKTRHVTYLFDHNQQQAAVFEEKCDSKGCSYASEILPEYAQDDILTLYHNAALMFGKEGVKELNASAVGSKQPVHVTIPEGKQLKTAKKAFSDTEGLYLLVILNQDIFSSDKGELYINLDSDMTVSKAVLKKTTLFGDIWGKIIEKRIDGSLE
ncbi:MAG: DUF3108 domain-containing protein [Campylobacteraceae bacterium]|jgi:hypothetical protein|nr:DUF3108 domain-containing protein [Campylobacteraceae bacterium]